MNGSVEVPPLCGFFGGDAIGQKTLGTRCLLWEISVRTLMRDYLKGGFYKFNVTIK